MEDLFNPGTIGVATTILIKMGIGVILGGAIGFERERHGRPAGLRTHMLVALGVVLFCIVSAAYPGSDPTRISAQVVTGIGFLGAGTIMRMGAEIKGLTSAASIWATSAISMAVARGGPYLLVATASTILVLLTLAYVDKIERKFKPVERASELLVTLSRRDDLHGVVKKLNDEGVEVGALRIIPNDNAIEAAMQVSGSNSFAIEQICSLSGVISAKGT